jgi:hypothetical protein
LFLPVPSGSELALLSGITPDRFRDHGLVIAQIGRTAFVGI